MVVKKFRKKPVEIEAVQWNGNNHREMFNFLGGEDADYITASGVNFYIDFAKVEGGLIIKTLEGEHIATIGDYIIKGIKGEFYPCKPNIFELTYEQMDYKGKVYISGKVTGIEKEATELFEKAERELQQIGYQTVNPMKLNHEHDKSWHNYMREDIKALCDCDTIYMLSNWKESKGAIIEMEIANHIGLKVIYEGEDF